MHVLGYSKLNLRNLRVSQSLSKSQCSNVSKCAFKQQAVRLDLYLCITRCSFGAYVSSRCS